MISSDHKIHHTLTALSAKNEREVSSIIFLIFVVGRRECLRLQWNTLLMIVRMSTPLTTNNVMGNMAVTEKRLSSK
jgi:hypothetical protein